MDYYFLAPAEILLVIIIITIRIILVVIIIIKSVKVSMWHGVSSGDDVIFHFGWLRWLRETMSISDPLWRWPGPPSQVRPLATVLLPLVPVLVVV